MQYYEDPILGKGRAADISGGTGGGTEYIGGFAIGISGDTISRLRYMPIESVTGSSVTLMAGHAYKAYATSTAITLNTETIPANEFGLEGHIEIYVAGTGYVVTGTNVVLAEALEPDSVNNCTVRFHDGVCIISVEDHVAGYIVVNGSTSGEGSLYYGISTSTNDYVAFDASLNGTTIPLAGAVAEGEKHIVGNGYTETTLTGAVDCGTSKFTVANLALSDVQVTGGTLTLGDVYIPQGGTVTIAGGRLGVEKVSGDGTIDLGETGATSIENGQSAYVMGCTVTNGKRTGRGGAFILFDGTLVLSSATVTGNTATGYGGALSFESGGVAYIISSVVSGNTGTDNSDIIVGNSAARLILDGSTVGKAVFTKSAQTTLNGSNFIGERLVKYDNTVSATVTITSGAILDLTGNTNTTPINPGGGVIVDGGCQVVTSAGASVSIIGGTYTKINNDGTTE